MTIKLEDQAMVVMRNRFHQTYHHLNLVQESFVRYLGRYHHASNENQEQSSDKE